MPISQEILQGLLGLGKGLGTSALAGQEERITRAQYEREQATAEEMAQSANLERQGITFGDSGPQYSYGQPKQAKAITEYQKHLIRWRDFQMKEKGKTRMDKDLDRALKLSTRNLALSKDFAKEGDAANSDLYRTKSEDWLVEGSRIAKSKGLTIPESIVEEYGILEPGFWEDVLGEIGPKRKVVRTKPVGTKKSLESIFK